MTRLHVKWHTPLAMLLLSPIILLLLTLGGRPASLPESDGSDALSATDHLPEDEADLFGEIEDSWDLIADRVQKGETASSLLGLYLTPGEIYQLAQQSRPIFPLSRLGAGQRYRLYLREEAFERFEYDINGDEQLIVKLAEEGFEISRQPIAYDIQQELVRGSIRTNLFEAVSARGEQVELAIALADLFAWDIDFIRDLRQDDTFQILIEKRFRDGERAGYGRILAAEFVNRSTAHQAFYFKNGKGSSYYDAEGRNVRKTFLRAPLSYSRISSGFSTRRLHPITKTWRAHPAIDYAAPPGTPIMTVGDGVITEIGYNRNNGNYIKIRHNSVYETIYLHMQGFAKGMRKNERLTQGQVIGYVGSTGLATGPHLCFRMLRNGSPVNPQTVKVPNAEPLPAELMANFKMTISPYLASFQAEEPDQLLVGRN
jgi:murein DD-endopeptidase MepM/ murein hydrolase activator NlpD